MALAIDLYCGLGGWTTGLLAEGWDVIGFDIERHVYGEHRYPAQLVIQDVLTLHGSQFRDAALIVASPPCQEYSYMAMPWKAAKAKAAAIRADTTGESLERLNRLFHACFRIQAEASMAAGHHIPMVVENVKGAQPWVGRARWNFGSFYLWGDVPALMPPIIRRKVSSNRLHLGGGNTFRSASGSVDEKRQVARYDHRHAERRAQEAQISAEEDRRLNPRSVDGTKNAGGSWFRIAHNTTSGHGQNPDGRKVPGFRFDGSGASFQTAAVAEVVKQGGTGEAWFDDEMNSRRRAATVEKRRDPMAASSGRSRKFASALIAKIPPALSRHIAVVYKPRAA